MALALTDMKNSIKHLTISLADIYECPADHRAEIKFALVSNVDGTNDADLSMTVLDYSASVTVYLSKTITVPADAALKPLGDLVGLTLEAGDKIQAAASADEDLDMVLSVIEYSI